MNGNALENKPDDFWKSIPYFPGRNPDADFSDAWKHLKKIVTKSHAVHTDPYHYCECAICGFRGKELSLHLKTHRISSDDYKATYNAKVKCDAIADSVKGENNPAFGHGGLYSPFSKKFIKGDVTEETKAKSAKTKEEHPERQPTRIEYYLAKGLSQEEAERALSERQSTFSLEKCVERYGELEGLVVWMQRQNRWQETLNSKSDEEKLDINRRKSVQTNYRSLWTKVNNNPGIFYVIETEKGIKIGITSQGSVQKRFNSVYAESLYEVHGTLTQCFQIEYLIKTDSELEPFRVSDDSFFGWTETFQAAPETIIDRVKFYERDYARLFEERVNRK